MKRIVINLVFTLTFLGMCCLLGATFSDDFVEAFSPDLFPKDESLGIASCQRWTDEVRNFAVPEGEQAEKVTVLMYHRVLDAEDIDDVHLEEDGLLQKTIILKSQFEEQMAMLKEENYTTLTAKEFQLFMENKLEVPKKSILLTFDDGYKDNVTEVYPVLKKHGFTALNFLITSALDKKTQKFDAEKHQYLSVSEIQKSCDAFEFQSHTYNFHKETEDERAYLRIKSKDLIMKDLKASLVNLDQQNRAFAYPFGEYDRDSIQSLKELGFEMAFTTVYDAAEPGMNMYEIPRKEVFPEDTVEDFRVKIRAD
jgi:peptidoglycan/xylan/chitin deacetylase (PgdA/CDA1 family)